MSAQSENIIESCKEYTDSVLDRAKLGGELYDQMKPIIQAAYLSGVMSSSMALAKSDGVHPSKLAQACREAGFKLLGVKSEPLRS